MKVDSWTTVFQCKQNIVPWKMCQTGNMCSYVCMCQRCLTVWGSAEAHLQRSVHPVSGYRQTGKCMATQRKYKFLFIQHNFTPQVVSWHSTHTLNSHCQLLLNEDRTNIPHVEQEKLAFQRQKPQTDPHSRWTASCLDLNTDRSCSSQTSALLTIPVSHSCFQTMNH